MYSFSCPVCGEKLNISGKSLVCSKGHNFDLAKTGYVNLLRTSSQGNHGDDKEMVTARTAFLNKGYYENLAAKVSGLCSSLSPSVVLDAGCGEGYYTSYLKRSLPDASVIGTDISKEAVAAAAKRNKGISFAVAGSNSLPIGDGEVDVVVSIFAPVFADEFSRVLKEGGFLIKVLPLEKHLHQLREAVYDTPYDNDPVREREEGFSVVGRENLEYTIKLDSNEDILSLFKMTPYYYKTGKKDQEKLTLLNTLETQLGFAVILLEKSSVSSMHPES